MATATATAPAQQQSKPANQSQSALALIDKEVEFKPFLAEETIKLSPGIIISYLAKPTKSGKVCDMNQAIRFMMLCKARGLNPWEGDAFLVGYDAKDGPEFNLVTAHQAFLKRAEIHPEYDGMKSGVVVVDPQGVIQDIEGDFFSEGYGIVGGWARVFFKNRTHPMYKRLRLSTFNKGYSRWQADPAGMIVKCAEADALRSAFPNSLGGMYLEQELAPGETSAAPAPLVTGRLDLRQPKQLSKPATNGTHVPPEATVIVQPPQTPEAAGEPSTNGNGRHAPSPDATPDILNEAAEQEAAERTGRANQ